MECEVDHRSLEPAKTLLLIRATIPQNRPPASKNHPLKAHRPPLAVKPVKKNANVFSVFLPSWGVRQRRSSHMVKLKRKRLEDPPCLAAVDGSHVQRSPGVHRSPDTPLDLVVVGSIPSTSGSDGAPSPPEVPLCKRFRSCEATAAQEIGSHIKVSTVERATMVEEDRPSQPTKRQGRKKTKSELQAEERFLLEDNERLTKILEVEMVEREAKIAENRRLLNELASSRRAPAEAEPEKLNFLLPDLNEPVQECLDPGCGVKHKPLLHCLN